MPAPSFDDPAVAARFAAFPARERAGMLALRDLIFDVAQDTDGVGAVQETLKWGQPAYLTPHSKSGTTLRLGLPKQGGIAIYAHCQTTVISDFRALFPDTFSFEGNRAVHLDTDAPLPVDPLRLLIRAALTYHKKPG